MSYYGSEVISVSGRGSAETAWLSATFTATVVTPGKTGPEAKEKARPIIDKILAAVRTNAKDGGIDTSRLQTTFNVSVHRNRATAEFDGYECTYTIKFTGTNVAAAPAVHDALTSIESVQSDTPKYNLDASTDVHATAFAAAVTQAKDKFAKQCKALGIDPADFEVKSWSPEDEEHRGKTLSYNTDGNSPKPIGLEPGKAQLDLKVNLVFVRRKPAAN